MAKRAWPIAMLLLAGCGPTSWLEPPVQRAPAGAAVAPGPPSVWFPRLSTDDLNGDRREIPHGLPGELKLFMVAYAEEQQAALAPWQAVAAELERAHPRFRGYGLPTLASSWTFARAMIDGVMRRDAPTRAARARILPLYIDKDRFNAVLELSERDVHAVLVDARGAVVWRRSGRADPEALAELRAEVTRRLQPPR